jgi:fatty-acyl-CoA synthase
VHPDAPAVVYGDVRRTWAQTYARCRRLASALARHGIGRGDTVSIIAANIPELFEAHFGVPMCGAVLNAINIRLDAQSIGFILDHAETRAVIVDPEFADTVEAALSFVHSDDLLVIDIEDDTFDESSEPIGTKTYEAFIGGGDPDFDWQMPADEWDAITLNYTSGTTGNPKGVVYHHRGAHLNALSHIVDWGMPKHARYLWTLPMFHCNGWCFPWTMAALAGTNVCMRAVRAEPIFRLIETERVTHFCGAPIVLNMLGSAPEAPDGFGHAVKVMTAGASPPAAVIARMEAMGAEVTHVYGLTETYGPAVICDWKSQWNGLSADERARLKARQGVANTALDRIMVTDPETREPVVANGEQLGEVLMRGNNVMRGYLKNEAATGQAFRDGWLASGDLGVVHPDGYIELKDRSKDIIISGGENISSIEIEDVLYRHPAVHEAAVVAQPHDKWGETPCAFVTLADGATATADEIIAFCRGNMATYKAPRTVIFTDLPKTSTGKIQKFVLRQRANELIADQPEP